MTEFATKHYLSRRFFGFNQKVSDESTSLGHILKLNHNIQASRNLNIIGDELYYFFSENEWRGPYFEVNGHENTSNELEILNFREFNDTYFPLNAFQVADFSFSFATEQLSLFKPNLPVTAEVVAALLSCDINKIELHFFVQ